MITVTYAGEGLLIARVLATVLDGRAWTDALPAVASVAVLQVARAGLTWLRETLAADVAGQIKDDVRVRLLDRLFALGPGYTVRTRTGKLQSTMVDGVEALERYYAAFLPQLVASLIGAIALTGYVCVLDPVVGATVAGCGLLMAFAPCISRRVMSAPMARWFTAYRDLYADTLDAVQGHGHAQVRQRAPPTRCGAGRPIRSFARDSPGWSWPAAPTSSSSGSRPAPAPAWRSVLARCAPPPATSTWPRC
ncbi:ABC-type transport system involved in cytochrome bd biosynthesis fused ATPase/permease subunit [Catenuloplanes nepalensis]|uniref:ABC-type transport system involved in cytochrome bd biosynthesis fused ATPase/permease subunit n=1 Tax=Catenuloplanes nepalensis TaxID=587533 RepID=A0ABT9MNV0_9ACTN|nr:ABC transporter transmembrane domain-containing protein [Catenuloplanes nepalensis]MDP9792963.1 ABC-type transport system involved in cytochrome bd biosynthesis fused ATPase/permease subunit [Catenuloplanes nepalensis]